VKLRVLVLILAFGSFAFGNVLYTDGADIILGGDYLSSPGASSQQFNLSVESILASMTISTWTTGLAPGTAGGPSTLSWTISTNPPGGGGVLDSGSSAVTNVFHETDGAYNIDNTAASLPGIDLAAGTYWLTLQSDTSSDNSTVYWGVTNPTGLGAQDSPDNVNWSDISSTYNLVLEIDGVSTPEPGTLGLLGLSLTGLAFLRKSFARKLPERG
jgi:PEP-CTERM motif